MIDRIRIYINDVGFEDVETRLDLSPSGIDKDGSFKYASTIKNLKFTYAGKQLKIAGSLHKYAKGNNYSLFTYEEAKNVLHELSDIIGIPLKRFVVTSMELGLNIKMDKEKSTEKIDGAVAMIMALDRAIRCGCVSEESVYDSREMLII